MSLLNVPTSHQVESCEEYDRNWGSKFRASAYALSGYALDVWFPIVEEAGAFASKWAKVIGGAVKVRKDGCQMFVVSVPVQKPSY